MAVRQWRYSHQPSGSLLVSRYFEPSQPQRVRAKKKNTKNFNLCPSYSALKSSNHKFSQIYKISPGTNFVKQNIKHNFFEELVLSVLSLLEKHLSLGHAGTLDHSVDQEADTSRWSPSFVGVWAWYRRQECTANCTVTGAGYVATDGAHTLRTQGCAISSHASRLSSVCFGLPTLLP